MDELFEWQIQFNDLLCEAMQGQVDTKKVQKLGKQLQTLAKREAARAGDD